MASIPEVEFESKYLETLYFKYFNETSRYYNFYINVFFIYLKSIIWAKLKYYKPLFILKLFIKIFSDYCNLSYNLFNLIVEFKLK